MRNRRRTTSIGGGVRHAQCSSFVTYRIDVSYRVPLPCPAAKMVMLDPTDTIAAVASPPGPGFRGLIRLTGPDAFSIALYGFSEGSDTTVPRHAHLRTGWLRVDALRPLLPATVCRLWPGARTLYRPAAGRDPHGGLSPAREPRAGGLPVARRAARRARRVHAPGVPLRTDRSSPALRPCSA